MINILRVKKASNNDLKEVITRSEMDYSSWVIVEKKGKKYKFYYVDEGYYWCSIEDLASDTFEIIIECYRKAKILQVLYFDIHATYEQLNNMVPVDMLDETFKIKDKCKDIYSLGFDTYSSNDINPNTIFFCESKTLSNKENSLSETLKEFGNYTILSSRESELENSLIIIEFTTNLPYDFYLFAKCS